MKFFLISYVFILLFFPLSPFLDKRKEKSWSLEDDQLFPKQKRRRVECINVPLEVSAEINSNCKNKKRKFEEKIAEVVHSLLFFFSKFPFYIRVWQKVDGLNFRFFFLFTYNQKWCNHVQKHMCAASHQLFSKRRHSYNCICYHIFAQIHLHCSHT